MGMTASIRTGEYAKAQILAKSKLEDLAESDLLMPGENEGQITLGDEEQIFRWRTRIENGRQETQGSLTPLQAIVEVTWDSESALSVPGAFELHALLISEKS